MMKYIGKRDAHKIIKQHAKKQGLSFSDAKANIQANIDDMMSSDDPFTKKTFTKFFGTKRPTPEEYISKMVNL